MLTGPPLCQLAFLLLCLRVACWEGAVRQASWKKHQSLMAGDGGETDLHRGQPGGRGGNWKVVYLLEVQGAGEVGIEAAQRPSVRTEPPKHLVEQSHPKSVQKSSVSGLGPQGPPAKRKAPCFTMAGCSGPDPPLCLIPEFQSLENKPLSHCLAPASAGKWGAGAKPPWEGGVEGLGAAKGALRGERGQKSRPPPLDGRSREGPPAYNPFRDFKAFLRECPVSPEAAGRRGTDPGLRTPSG